MTESKLTAFVREAILEAGGVVPEDQLAGLVGSIASEVSSETGSEAANEAGSKTAASGDAEK